MENKQRGRNDTCHPKDRRVGHGGGVYVPSGGGFAPEIRQEEKYHVKREEGQGSGSAKEQVDSKVKRIARLGLCRKATDLVSRR